jgi:sulfotransferase 6B1
VKLALSTLLILTLSNAQIDTHPAMLLISIPKCGTHLMGKLLGILTNQQHRTPGIKVVNGFEQVVEETLRLHKQGKFPHIHYNFSKKGLRLCKDYNIRLFFIYRDPRDQIIAWVMSENTNDLRSINERIADVMDSTKEYFWGYYGINDVYTNITPWATSPGVCAVKFEDLVGPAGGGSIEKQYAAIDRVAQHLAMPLSNTVITLIANELFGKSTTFREGKIGAWKEYFTPEHKDLFKKHAGQILIDLGYEKDFNW